METLRLALRLARRELRSGFSGFRIFLASLILGVAAIAGVGSLGQAFLTGLSEQGATLLGGDVGLERLYRPATAEERAFFARFGRVAEFASLRSMVTGGSPSSRALIELKAVDGAYPLVGAMSLAPAMSLPAALACTPAQCGAVVEDALLKRLGVSIGAVIRIGSKDFVIRGQIVAEPDRVAGGFALGPQVMIARDALSQAGLLVTGSLIDYSYRIVLGGGGTPESFRAAADAAFPDAGWHITERTNAVPQVTQFVERATMFLTLIALSALVVGGVGAGQAVEGFLERRRDTIATLKAMGATGGQVFLIYLLQILAVAALALVLGLSLGAALPLGVGHFFGAAIPAPARYGVYPGPLALASAFGALAALGFAIPPLARAREIAPAGLFRDRVARAKARARLSYRVAAAAIFALIALLAIALLPYPLFTLGFIGGAVLVLGALRLAALALRHGIKRVPQGGSQSLRLALANLTRPHAPTAGIVVALGLGLTLLATVTLIEASMRAQVEDQLPSRVPSFVFIDIQQSEIDALKTLVAGFATVTKFDAVPMARARIVKLKGVPVSEAEVDSGARWILDGDHGVTYSSAPPKEAHVVEGPAWWPADYRGPSLVSFDRKLARGMHLELGDIVTINVAGRDLDLTLYNLRDIDYRSAGIKFIFVVSPGVIEKAPHSFIADLRIGAGEEEAVFAAVSKGFPNITAIHVKEALARVGQMLAVLTRGVAVASLITILAGIIVLAGAVAARHRARLYDAVVLKVLGATRARLALVYAIEYGVLGAFAGLAALAAGSLAAWAVTRFVFDIPLAFAGRALVLTVLGGAAGTLVLGLAGGVAALSAKPARLLRSA